MWGHRTGGQKHAGELQWKVTLSWQASKGFRRERLNVSEDARMEPREEEINRVNAPCDPTLRQDYWLGRPGGVRAEAGPALAGKMLVQRKV